MAAVYYVEQIISISGAVHSGAGIPPTINQVGTRRPFAGQQRVTDAINDIAEPDFRILIKDSAILFKSIARHAQIAGKCRPNPLGG